MKTREEKFELIQKHLAHLNAKVIAMVEGKEEDVVLVIKTGGFATYNVRAHDEHFVELFGSQYFGQDQQAEAEATWYQKTQELAKREVGSNEMVAPFGAKYELMTTKDGRWQSLAQEVCDEDDGMLFAEAVDLMNELEEVNSPGIGDAEIGVGSSTAAYTLSNADGENWTLTVDLMDAMGDEEENDYPQAYAGQFRFTFHTADGMLAYHEWLESEVL